MSITFFGMKAVVLAGRDGPRLPAARRLLFLVWPGMNPRLFVRSRSSDPARARQLARRALRNAVIGLALIGSARVVGHPAAAPVLMVGLSLLVHFGVFTGLAAALLAAGFPVRVLFDAPWRARTPDEFWTRRWNRGFAEMTSVAVQRPLAERWGRRRALLGSFLVSGLLHEAAISPASVCRRCTSACKVCLRSALARIRRVCARCLRSSFHYRWCSIRGGCKVCSCPWWLAEGPREIMIQPLGMLLVAACAAPQRVRNDCSSLSEGPVGCVPRVVFRIRVAAPARHGP